MAARHSVDNDFDHHGIEHVTVYFKRFGKFIEHIDFTYIPGEFVKDILRAIATFCVHLFKSLRVFAHDSRPELFPNIGGMLNGLTKLDLCESDDWIGILPLCGNLTTLIISLRLTNQPLTLDASFSKLKTFTFRYSFGDGGKPVE